jgi:hypothetical protein
MKHMHLIKIQKSASAINLESFFSFKSLLLCDGEPFDVYNRFKLVSFLILCHVEVQYDS